MPKNVRLLFPFLVCFLIITLLSSCNFSEVRTCEESEITYPENLLPEPYTLLDTLTPTLSWTYPDKTCNPDHYEIYIYSDDTTAGPRDLDRFPVEQIHFGTTDATSYTIPASAGLQPGQTYFWELNASIVVAPGRQVISWFSTGPLCTSGASLVAPTLLLPPDGEQVYMPGTINLEWDNNMTCWPGGDFYVQVSRTSDFSDIVYQGTSSYMEAKKIDADPARFEDCTWYYWRVRADPAGGGEGPYSATWSFRYSTSETLCPIDLSPTEIPPEILAPPRVRLLMDANCRSGPTGDYTLLSVLPAGGEYDIQMQNRAGDSFMIFDPAINGTCWVYSGFVDVIGDIGLVEFGDPDPPPLVMPSPTSPPAGVDCSQYTEPTSCNNNTACWWDPNDPPQSNGSCKNK